MAGYTVGIVQRQVPNSPGENWWEAGTIRAVRIVIYLIAFATVIGFAAAIAWLSIIVAPVESKERWPTMLVIALGGLAVAGGVVYLAEKLINLAKGVALMLAELIVEKYKKHRFEMGKRVGLERGLEQGLEQGREVGLREGQDSERRAWQTWYLRQQAAQRAGLPFDEPPPGYERDNGGHSGTKGE